MSRSILNYSSLHSCSSLFEFGLNYKDCVNFYSSPTVQIPLLNLEHFLSVSPNYMIYSQEIFLLRALAKMEA